MVPMQLMPQWALCNWCPCEPIWLKSTPPWWIPLFSDSVLSDVSGPLQSWLCRKLLSPPVDGIQPVRCMQCQILHIAQSHHHNLCFYCTHHSFWFHTSFRQTYSAFCCSIAMIRPASCLFFSAISVHFTCVCLFLPMALQPQSLKRNLLMVWIFCSHMCCWGREKERISAVHSTVEEENI